MSIDKTLREDATRLVQVQPPTDLRARLQASLEVLPPHIAPLRPKRQVHKWFMPAAAMLVLAMIVVLIPPQTIGIPATKATLTYGEPENDTSSPGHDFRGENFDTTSEDHAASNRVTGPAKELPLGRMGIFAGLAVITGFLCLTELRGRRRLLIPALVALAIFLTAGVLYFLGAV